MLGMKLGFNESAAAFMLSSCLAGGLTIPALIGRVSDRVNRRSLLIFLMTAFGTLCIILPYTIHSSLLRAVNCFFIGGFGGGIFAVTMAEIGARFKGAEVAVAYAATGALWGVGSVSGNIVLGYTMGLSNVSWILTNCGCSICDHGYFSFRASYHFQEIEWSGFATDISYFVFQPPL
ncbi:MFS transporter [Pseudomonas chlororaphis]|uniref:MFS transporter n=1 Tax=Pseudomonas chlororaphis TaxID=587753 RepID=UPI00236736C1|nr:MFS transporter [Pseudomonas chlororaphis]WDH24427.1 MFS transporter [Pseudomonas chlororaphis]